MKREMVAGMKNKKRIYEGSYVVLFLITVFCCAFFCWQNGMFGSKVDWISQHSVLPDYFRKHFYETGKIFPEFAFNLGGGQNIYHYSYYGLYSPLIFISYLLPFVKMSDYMMVMQFLCLAASVLLMYRWLIKQNFSMKISFGTAVIFLLSGPMIFHSYNQIMFVNYMPFLCLAFMSVDRYFEDVKKRKSGCLILSMFLMIMTSFYFSIGGLLAIVIYGIYRFFRMCDTYREKVTVKYFFQEGIRFAICIIISILMSAVLLIPTAMALAGRGGNTAALNLADMLLPAMPVVRFLYSPYGIGLTTFSVTTLIAMLFFPKKHEKILAWGCLIVLTIPLFAYLLNGGLYIRDKVMIPFLPVLCYITAYYLDRLEKIRDKKIPLFTASIPYMILIIWILLNREELVLSEYWTLFLGDAVIMIICWLIYYKKRIVLCFLILPIVFLFAFGSVMHVEYERYLDPEFYEQVTDEQIGKIIQETAESETGFYRIEQSGSNDENAANLNRIWDMDQYISSIYSSSYNQDYQKFREDIFHLQQPFRNFLMQTTGPNPVFRKFMGIKYTIRNKRVYTDEMVSPVVYATDRIISEESYEKLSFPWNQLALLQYAVTEGGRAEGSFEEQRVQNVDLAFPSEVELKENQNITLELPDSQTGSKRVLFITFEVDNPHRANEVSIWINGVKNKLSSRNAIYYNDNRVFYYAVPLKEDQTGIDVTLGRGEYEILNVESYLADLAEWEEDQKALYQSEMALDRDKTEDNLITGTIDVKNDGYLITTIPYDDHFEIRIDGKESEIEKVNTSFLGCKIDRGSHEVEIIYHAPGLGLGKVVSAAGLMGFVLLLAIERRKTKK